MMLDVDLTFEDRRVIERMAERPSAKVNVFKFSLHLFI